MRWKLKSDKSFLEFLGSGGVTLKVGAIAILGILLILFGGIFSTEKAVDIQSSEERVAEMCSLIDGVGQCRVMMTYYPDDQDRVYAVLVLCDGADSVKVREQITSLFTSLYGIGSNRVKIGRLIE